MLFKSDLHSLVFESARHAMIKTDSVDNHLKAFVLFLDSNRLVCLAIDYWVNIKLILGIYSESIN